MHPEGSRVFKDWVVPAPLIDRPPPESVPHDETVDSLSGGTWIYQLKEGHRFSTDDLLVAWFGTTNAGRTERALDLGSGIGTVAQIVAWRWPRTTVTAIEAQERSVELFRKSIALNRTGGQIEIREGDFREPGLFSEGETFGAVFGSPPYWPETDGVVSEHPQKRACRFEVRGGVEAYCETAARVLSPAGHFFLVFPTAQNERVIGGAENAGLRCIRHRAVELKAGEPPLLTLYQFQRVRDLPERYLTPLGRGGFAEPALRIRDEAGRITLEYMNVKGSIGFPP